MKVLQLIFLSFLLVCAEAPNVAISSFKGLGISQTEADLITERFRTEVVKQKSFPVMERAEMKAIVEEMEFQQTDLCDQSECLIEYGHILGVEKIISGSIGKVGELYTLSIRVIDLNTSLIEHSISMESHRGLEHFYTVTLKKAAKDIRLQTDKPPKKVPTIRVGYVGSDHNSALYIALKEAAHMKSVSGLHFKEVVGQKVYELHRNEERIARVKLIKFEKGRGVSKAMEAGRVDVGFGNISAMLSAIDRGSAIKLIAPLQKSGNLFVLQKESSIKNWEDFVLAAKSKSTQMRIGYSAPRAVSKYLFEQALQEVGISYTEDRKDSTCSVLFVPRVTGKKLNQSLKSKDIDGYVKATPAPIFASVNGLGNIIADLNEIVPENKKEYLCCGIGATNSIIKKEPEIITCLLQMMHISTAYLDDNPALAARTVGSFLGTGSSFEKESMQYSSYDISTDERFMTNLYNWIGYMIQKGHYQERLKEVKGESKASLFSDFSLMAESVK